MKRLRIGTRGSSLALWQANHIAGLLAQRHGIEPRSSASARPATIFSPPRSLK